MLAPARSLNRHLIRRKLEFIYQKLLHGLEIRAETDYNKAIANLQRATSTTMRANNIIVDTPTVP
jgi:hypothetical protein